MQTGISLWGEKCFSETVFLKNIIVDRGSKYSVLWTVVMTDQEIKEKMEKLKLEKYFSKASHNSYGYRIQGEYGVIEGKNDDGETGAGNCILRELQRENYINSLVVVTRYFWGIHLQADRFKNIVNACKIVLEKQKNK